MPPRLSPRALHGVACVVAAALLASPAAAEVRFEGDARMGLLRGADTASDEPRWSFTSRLRVTLRAEGRTDGGLTFGGQLRLDQADRAAIGRLAPGRD